MKIINKFGWAWYIYSKNSVENLSFKDNIGKWMIFFKDKSFAERLCKSVIKDKIIVEAKHSIKLDKYESGVCCLYLDGEDYVGHKKLINYLIKNDYLPHNKDGSYTNIAFKYDFDTDRGVYGNAPNFSMHLKDFIDLKTGKWTYNHKKRLSEQNIEKTISRKVSKYFNIHGGNRWSLGYLKFNNKDEFNFQYIKDYIKENNVKIKEIANKLDVSEKSIRNWINGKTRPYVWNAIAICVLLNLNEDMVIIRKK